MRTVVAAVALPLFLTLACGDSAASDTSGIAGSVTLGSECSRNTINMACRDHLRNVRVAVFQELTLVADGRIDARGNFGLPVPPGDYNVSIHEYPTMPSAILGCSFTSVTVRERQWVSLSAVCDARPR